MGLYQKLSGLYDTLTSAVKGEITPLDISGRSIDDLAADRKVRDAVAQALWNAGGKSDAQFLLDSQYFNCRSDSGDGLYAMAQLLAHLEQQGKLKIPEGWKQERQEFSDAGVPDEELSLLTPYELIW